MAKKFLTSINLSGNALLNASLQPSAFAPNAMAAGQVYYNTADGALYFSTGTGSGNWQQLATGTTSVATLNNFIGAVTLNGTTDNITVNNSNNVITLDIGSNVVTLSDTQTLTNKTLADATLSTNLNANGYKVTGLIAPTAGGDAANKQYVDDSITNVTLNIQGTAEQISVNDQSGVSTISLPSVVRIDNQIKLGTNTNAPIISLDATSGENYFGGNGVGGYLEVKDANNNSAFSVSSNGRVTIYDGNGNQTIRIQGHEIYSRNGNSINIYADSGPSSNLDFYAGNNAFLGAGSNVEIYANDNGQGGDVNVSGVAINLNSPTYVNNNNLYVQSNTNGTIFQVDPANQEVTIKGTLRFLDQNASFEALETVNNQTEFYIAADYSIRLNSSNGGIYLEPDTWAYVNNDAIVTENDAQTLTNKTISDNLHFQNSGGLSQIGANGNDLNIISNSGNVHITSNNQNIILDADGTTYLNSATLGNEVVATSWTQTLSNKTLANTTLGNNLDANEYKIINLADPEHIYDAANKRYVDAAVAGLTWKDAVNLLADSNVPLSGNTPLTIDTQTVDNGYRVLLTGQSTATENGIYLATVSGGVYTLNRSADADTNDELKGVAVFVMEGDVYGTTSWTQSNHYISNFADQVWVQFSGSGTYLAGDGLTLNGTIFSFNPTSNGGLNSDGSIKLGMNTGLQTTSNGLSVVAGEGIILNSGAVAIDTTLVTRKADAILNRSNSVLAAGLTWVVEHNLNSFDTIARVYQWSSGSDQYMDLEVDIKRNSENEIQIDVAQAIDAGYEMKLVVIG